MRKTPANGFSLMELLSVVAIIGVITSVGIAASGNEWRREQVNTVATDLTGWLETIRRSALKGNACQVTISGGNIAAGATLATASEIVGAPTIASNCLASHPLRISATLNRSAFTIAPSGSTSFKFTPRGTVNAQAANAQLTSPIVIEISLAGSSGPLRCVRISPGLGLISIGASNVTSGSCPDSSYGGTL